VSKKITHDEFAKLEKYWYDKLAENGFNDIENEKICYDPFKNLHPTQIEATREYYILVWQAVSNPNTKYRNIADKLIMLWYADGVRIKTMTEKLVSMGMPKDRKTIRIIIRRYLLAWGIRSFTRAELNLK
jgi:hypothetical protein